MMADNIVPEKEGTEPPIFAARLEPYRSLGPRGFAAVMGFVALVSFSAGYVFYRIGAWPVMGFCGLDVAIIYVAFRVNYRSARAFEEVEVRPHAIVLRKVSSRGRTSEFHFNPAWVRLELEANEDEGVTRISLFSHGRGVSVGDFLNPPDRTSFAKGLAGAIREARG